MLTKINSKNIGFYLAFLITTSIGVYLRLDQFTLQVLLDDEWHVIHQLLVKTPKELFLTFGHADFSIPLALMYGLEQKLFGLSEFGMRWPMMLAGLSALFVFPHYVGKYFDHKTTLIFSFLLAISPLLIIYSRTARPYALTLLFSSLALGAFHRFAAAEKPAGKAGCIYVVCAIASVWLHLISLPMVVAPFLVFGIPALLDQNWERVSRIFCLGICTAVGLLTLVLPPILGQPEALELKLGIQTPNLETYYGVLYVWLGTSSLSVVSMGVLLAATGAGPLWRGLPIISSFVTGLGLTLIVILLTQPAWVHHPLTLARYLLPTIPLLLLSISLGLSRLVDMLVHYGGRSGKWVLWAATMSGLLLVGYFSPLHKILAKPNSNGLHLVYQFDFREENNLIFLYQKDFPVSPFWQQLAAFPRDTLKIAASPFAFETFHWDAARWEQISHQRVMPGYLNGFCTENRYGEVPKDKRFSFQNVGYLADENDLIERGFDLVVYQKPFKVMTNQGEKEFGMDTIDCDFKLRAQFPSPVYEDEWLVAFPLSASVRSKINATR